jgi:cyclase
MERRNFLKANVITLVAFALSKITSAADLIEFAAAYNIKMLTDNCGVFTEQCCSILFLKTQKGLIMVNSQFPEPAQHLIDEKKKIR